jgi:hypothetical protein
VITASTVEAGEVVVMANCVATWFGATVTLDGTLTLACELERVTTVPALDGWVRRTDPKASAPPVTEAGSTVIDETLFVSASEPLTGKLAEVIGELWESVAEIVKVSPARPVTGTRNEPSALALSVNVAAERTFVTLSTMGVFASVTAPTGPVT